MQKHDNKPKLMIGVDVSKDKLDIYFLDGKRHTVIENNQKSLKSFIKTLSKDRIGQYQIIMEYTGGYEKLSHKQFHEAGFSVHVAHPLRLHYFAKQKGYFGKTDKLDARISALYGKENELAPSIPSNSADKELKELSSRRNQLVDQLTKEKCRLKAHLSTAAIRSIKRMIKHLEKEISLVDEQINKHIEADEEKQAMRNRLETFKGVGRRIANALICDLPELGILNREKIACLVGVAPRNNDSGTKQGCRRICGGRFYIRKLLYMAALVAIRHNPTLKAFYERLKMKSKPSKVALTAVMRKMLITLNAMLRTQTDWQANY